MKRLTEYAVFTMMRSSPSARPGLLKGFKGSLERVFGVSPRLLEVDLELYPRRLVCIESAVPGIKSCNVLLYGK